ncbi:MAG: hypothetical protein EPN60_07450, partial [Nevskiaceae bacterium]
MKMKSARRLLLIALAWSSTPALALDWEWDEARFSLKNSYSVGAAIRMQDRNGMLVGKLNTPG